jgi:MFS family permease
MTDDDAPGNTQIEPDPSVMPTDSPPHVSGAALDDDSQRSAGNWSVGSLTYTRVGLAVLFCLLLWGDFAWSMKERSAAPILQILIKDFHASDTEMLMFTLVIPNLIGILLGPIVSYRSDRYRSRWGRRIPFLMVSTPFAALALIGLGFSPAMGQSLHHALGSHSIGMDPCIRLFFGLFWVTFEVATVAANSVFGGLINDVVPRPLLGRFYGLFRAFSLIAGIAVNSQLLGLAETYYRAIFIGISLLYGLGFAFMCLTVKEGEYPPPTLNSADARSGGPLHAFFDAARVYYRECFLQPYYLWVVIALTLASLTFMPVNLFSQPFAKSLHISNDAYGQYLSATYVISLALSVFIGYLADRFHPLRTGIATMILYAVVMLWGEFYAADNRELFTVSYHFWGAYHSFPIQLYAVALIAHGVISGVFFTCTASLGQRLFPHSRFAQFASAAALTIAIGSVALALSGRYFDTHGHIYKHTYIMGFGFAVLSIVAMMVVHSGFMRLGGTKSYVAP